MYSRFRLLWYVSCMKVQMKKSSYFQSSQNLPSVSIKTQISSVTLFHKDTERPELFEWLQLSSSAPQYIHFF